MKTLDNIPKLSYVSNGDYRKRNLDISFRREYFAEIYIG